MATLDQLPAEQRAIIELVLQQQRSYADLSGMLGMSAARVKELARDALGELSPRTYGRVDPEWRGQVADYLLGQQSGPESTATRGHLKSSEAARAWANSLLDALDPLYGNGARPEIPEAGAPEPVRRSRSRERTGSPLAERRPRERAPRKPREPLSPEAERVVRRRRLIGGGIAALVAAGIAALLIFVVLGGDDEKKKAGGSAAKAGGTPVPLGQLALKPVNGQKGQGQAILVRANGQLQLVVAARGLQPNQRGKNGQPGSAYEVWLFNSPKDAKSIGAQVTDQQGNYQGAGPLPKNFDKFQSINVSREPIDRNESYSGDTVLSGKLSSLKAVDPNAAAQAQQQQQQQQQGQQGAQGQTTPQP
jgi:hypothetical protein